MQPACGAADAAAPHALDSFLPRCGGGAGGEEGDAAPAAKRARVESDAAAAPAAGGGDPLTVVCLNLDGLASRLLPKKAEAGSGAARAAAAAHAAALLAHLAAVAGAPPDVLCLCEVHLKARSATNQREPEAVPAGGTAAARQPSEAAQAAVATLLSAPALRGYTPLWSLHRDARGRAGVCALLRPGLAPAAPPRFSLDLDAPAAAHHAEGRVIALEFASLRLLLTYTPNSGATDESRLRRAAFDAQLSAFVAAPHAKPLLWCGDLNVAPDAALDLLPSPSSFPRDLAGTTAAEQTRFRTICAAGGLRDVWRVRNPGARGGMTWRGAAYLAGCSMRLDHFVASAALLPRVAACEAAAPRGDAADTRGPRGAHPASYFGSDHWPLWLTLRPAAEG